MTNIISILGYKVQASGAVGLLLGRLYKQLGVAKGKEISKSCSLFPFAQLFASLVNGQTL